MAARLRVQGDPNGADELALITTAISWRRGALRSLWRFMRGGGKPISRRRPAWRIRLIRSGPERCSIEGGRGRGGYRSIPEYLSALNATWLNESATLFRQRYYKNGSHAGFIL